MPRCGAEAGIVRDPVGTTMDINVVTPTGSVALTGAVIFRVLRGEWHPVQMSGNAVVMNTQTDLPYQQMDLIVQWPPQSGVATTLFLPSASTAHPQALEGLATMFGIAASQVGTYVSSNPNASSPGLATAWKAFSCLLGDERPDGTKLSEVIMTHQNGTRIRGGWVFAEVNGPQEDASAVQGSLDNGVWQVLPSNRFAIIGGKLGALFGSDRRLYFEVGVDDTFRARVRSEFGFGAADGEDAYIKVRDFGQDFLLEVIPE